MASIEDDKRNARGRGEVDPLGVRLRTQEFLNAARAAGADQAVDERRRHLLDVYFGSRIGTADLGATVGVSGHRARVLLRSGLRTIWEHLPAAVQELHPSEEVIFLKANKGQPRPPQTPEHRAKLSATNRGRHVGAETRAKLSEARRGKSQGKGRPSPLKGRALSPETRQKMSRALQGRKSPMKGRQHAVETREKISESQRQRWERRRQAAADGPADTPVSATTAVPTPRR